MKPVWNMQRVPKINQVQGATNRNRNGWFRTRIRSYCTKFRTLKDFFFGLWTEEHDYSNRRVLFVPLRKKRMEGKTSTPIRWNNRNTILMQWCRKRNDYSWDERRVSLGLFRIARYKQNKGSSPLSNSHAQVNKEDWELKFPPVSAQLDDRIQFLRNSSTISWSCCILRWICLVCSPLYGHDVTGSQGHFGTHRLVKTRAFRRVTMIRLPIPWLCNTSKRFWKLSRVASLCSPVGDDDQLRALNS